MTSIFNDFTAADVRLLVDTYPFAWVCSTDAQSPEAAQLPLVGEYDAEGKLVALIGHMARANPLHARLAAHPHALMLFSGPDAYVSPSHAGKRDWAPTWNHAQLRIQTNVGIDSDWTDHSLDVLIAAMENGWPQPWSRQEIAGRYDRMAAAIIGFRAAVTTIDGRFKLGQDEDAGTFQNIVDSHPDTELIDWMRRFHRADG